MSEKHDACTATNCYHGEGIPERCPKYSHEEYSMATDPTEPLSTEVIVTLMPGRGLKFITRRITR